MRSPENLAGREEWEMSERLSCNASRRPSAFIGSRQTSARARPAQVLRQVGRSHLLPAGDTVSRAGTHGFGAVWSFWRSHRN
ncbi:hypothetical protein MRX96_025067 [Rhipicephalus microplus]